VTRIGNWFRALTTAPAIPAPKKTAEEAAWEAIANRCPSIYRDATRDFRCMVPHGSGGRSHSNPELPWAWSEPPTGGDFWARRPGSKIVPGAWYHEWERVTPDVDNIADDGSNWPTRGLRCAQCGEVREHVYMQPGQVSPYGRGAWPGRCPGPQDDR
jgi:hypothetical protein